MRCVIGIVVYCSVLGCSAGARANQVEIPFGRIDLLAEYRHEQRSGVDSMSGRIWKESGLSIRYDIGGLSGNIAGTVPSANRRWLKQQSVEKGTLHLVMTTEGNLIASFNLSSGPGSVHQMVNFIALTQTPEEIAEFLLIVMSYQYNGLPPTTQGRK